MHPIFCDAAIQFDIPVPSPVEIEVNSVYDRDPLDSGVCNSHAKRSASPRRVLTLGKQDSMSSANPSAGLAQGPDRARLPRERKRFSSFRQNVAF
jgi:hypothetical protein